MTELMTELRDILIDQISYCSDSGFVNRNAWSLVEGDKFPFFNIIKNGGKIEKLSNMNFNDIERRIYKIEIQFATSALNEITVFTGDDNRIGIEEFAEDILTALKTDFTVNSVVQGLNPDNEVIEWEYSPEIIYLKNSYVARATITLEYFNDVGKL